MNKKHEHLLLRIAKKFVKYKNNPAPSGCKYDFKIGAWILEETGEILADTSYMKGLETKKNDIETGEDLKSE